MGGGVAVAQRKQDEDVHVHEALLPDGTTIETGPPIHVEVEPAEPEAPAPPQSLRRKAAPSATAPDPEAAFFAQRIRASAAEGVRDSSRLPEDGSAIWNRMRQSAIRFAGADKASEGYAEELAWRAVRQHYGLGEFSPQAHAGKRRKGEFEDCVESVMSRPDFEPQEGRTAEESARAICATKPGGPAAGGKLDYRGAFVVPIAPNRASDLLHFGRVVTRTLPGSGGVSVRMGLHAKGRTLIDVTLPGSLLGTTSDPRSRAAHWVAKNWAAIRAAAFAGPGTRPPEVFHVERAPVLKWLRQSKIYYHSPEKATERIAYGEAYVPWEVDLQGQYATADEVVRMAHGFLTRQGKAGEMHSRWVMPDGSPAGEVVESFIARPGDPDFVPGAWVMGTKYHPEVWKGIQSGRYRGLSIGGEWSLRPLDVRVAAILEEAA